MNRQQRRASSWNGRRLQKKEWNNFEDVTIEAIAKARKLNPLSNYTPHAVFQNNQYIVQVFHDRQVLGHSAIKAMIRRCDAEPECDWPSLQRIKNELFGEDATAIQVFPPQSELVDDANLYWLWIVEGE